MERGRYRRWSSCPCWVQRRSMPGSLWGRTAPSCAFKTAAADENFRAVSIVFKEGFTVFNAEIVMRGQPLRAVAMEEDESRRSGGGGEICGETPRGRGTESGRPFFSRMHVGRSGNWAGAIGRPTWSTRVDLATKSDPYASASGQKKRLVRGLDRNGQSSRTAGNSAASLNLLMSLRGSL
jgi:hypothetical protein